MEDGEWVLVKRPAIKDLWRLSSVESDQDPKPLKLTFIEPAKHWTDAIPIGNGRLGAMLWGGVPSETLQLNGKAQGSFCIVYNLINATWIFTPIINFGFLIYLLRFWVFLLLRIIFVEFSFLVYMLYFHLFDGLNSLEDRD